MGKRVGLSNGRRLVGDVIHRAQKMPLAGIAGDFDAGAVAKLRRRTRPRISWHVIYMKAYAQVCREAPELLRGYAGFPWGYFYEHHEPVCMMTMAREYRGEERLFFARFNKPDHYSLVELQQQYDHYRKSPIEGIKQWRHQIRFAHAPGWLRRFAWWMLFDVWPEKRASHVGTFGMSISGYQGAYGSRHLGPNTTTLGIDPFPRKGVSRLVLTFDHRVLDGMPAARALSCLQRKVQTAIRRELAELVGVDPETLQPQDSSVGTAAAESESYAA